MLKSIYLMPRQLRLIGAAATLATGVSLVPGVVHAGLADYPVVQQATLLDRLQIEDLMIRYMYALEDHDPDIYSEVFTEDAVLDVNGIIFNGRKSIYDFAVKMRDEPPAVSADKRIHMLLSNIRIVVKGDTATVKALWTGFMTDRVEAQPRVFEQGRYNDELIKKNGRWYFAKRYITSDAGLDHVYDKTYKPRF